MNTATSIEFKGYTAAGALVGSVIVNTSAFNFNFSNVTLNFSGIRKLTFHPIGFDPNAMGGGSFFLDYFSVTFATSNNLSSVSGILKSNGNAEITAAVSGTDFLAPTGSAAGLTNFPTLNQNTTGTAANVSGVVAIANGGTAATTAAVALTNLGAAPIDSPTFTGVPLAPTPINTTNTTQIATTAFVTNAVSAATSGAFVDLTSAQTVAGNKSFSSDIVVNGITVGNGAGNEFNTKLNVLGSASFRTNVTNSGLIFDGYSPSGSLEVSRIYTDATSGTPSDFVLGTYPNAHSNQLYLKQSNGFVGIKTASPTTALDVNGTVTATSFVKSGGSSSEYLMADGSVSSGSGGGSTTVGAISSTSNSNGATITSGELNLAPANATNGGIVTTADQTFTGNKTFSAGLKVENKPFLPTKLNQSQINSLTGVEEGMVVYNTDTRKLQVFSVGNTDTTNELYSGNFSNGRDSIIQTYVPQVSGTVYAFQFFAKKSIQNYPWAYLAIDYNSGYDSIDLQSLTTSAEWITINMTNPFTVTAGNSYNFYVWSSSICGGDVLLGTNSNYSNGSITNSYDCINGGLLNGDDLMFRILITPSSSTAYWLNLN